MNPTPIFIFCNNRIGFTPFPVQLGPASSVEPEVLEKTSKIFCSGLFQVSSTSTDTGDNFVAKDEHRL